MQNEDYRQWYDHKLKSYWEGLESELILPKCNIVDSYVDGNTYAYLYENMTIHIVKNGHHELSRVKCDYCESLAIQGSEDPFASEIDGCNDFSHFCCDKSECEDKYEEDLYQSAMDV